MYLLLRSIKVYIKKKVPYDVGIVSCMYTCCTWLLLYAPPGHLPSICPFTRPYVLISALSMYLPPVLWACICAPATHFLGARILTTLTTSTPPAAFSALPQHLSSPFSVIVLSSQYLFQRGPIWINEPQEKSWTGICHVTLAKAINVSGTSVPDNLTISQGLSCYYLIIT